MTQALAMKKLIFVVGVLFVLLVTLQVSANI